MPPADRIREQNEPDPCRVTHTVTGLLSHYKHDDSDVISFLIYASWFSEPLVGKSLRNVCYSAGA